MTEEERVVSAACVHCANFQNADWRGDGMIYYVNLSMYPAPCQCHCMYCDVWENKRNFNFDENTEKAYEKMFETLKYLKEKGKIAPDARWQVSTGEIAIHPYKKQIMELIGNGNATFYTNAFKYDEDIAENLHNNPRSAIDVSIDSGTPETWQKIKGFDNFETVAINLTKYYQKTSRPGQITLKYIVMPGINDNAADYVSLLEIMKILNCSHLTISRDTRKKYNQDEKENQQLCISAGFLAAMCRKQDISIDLFTYTPEERQKVINVANNLLINGKV